MSSFRVGIIGCGRIASTFEDESTEHPASIAGAFDALPNAQLAAAASRGEERLRAFGERWGVTALYHDYREMLRKESLDIVCVATHPPLHRDMVVAAAEAGARGIFCEKPMALSLGECDEMLGACDNAGSKLLVNCTRRWSGLYESAKRLIASGKIGELLHIVAHCQGCKPLPSWQSEHEGPLLHDAVHTFDTMRMFAGEAEWVLGTAIRRKRLEYRVEDTSYALLQFTSGADGVVITDELTEYERWDIELQCERGLLRLGTGQAFFTTQELEFERGFWQELIPDSMPQPAWTEPGILLAARDLIEGIEQNRECRCTGRDGRADIEIIMALYESQRRGNVKVRMPLAESRSVLGLLRDEDRL